MRFGWLALIAGAIGFLLVLGFVVVPLLLDDVVDPGRVQVEPSPDGSLALVTSRTEGDPPGISYEIRNREHRQVGGGPF